VPAHITGLMGHYTEIGVVNRRETDPAQIVADIDIPLPRPRSPDMVRSDAGAGHIDAVFAALSESRAGSPPPMAAQ